jgi:hypothetical protein
VRQRYAVIREPADPDELFERVEDAFDVLSGRDDLVFVYAATEEDDPRLRVHVWREVHERALVRLVEDGALRVRYLAVEGDSDATAAAIEDALREALPTVAPAELRERAREEMGADPDALVRAALGSGAHDAETSDLLRGALSSRDVKLRQSAAMAAALTRWRQLEPELETALARETDPTAQALLRQALLDVRETSGG